MKRHLIAFIILFSSLFASGQNDITVLNGYKYFFIAPLEYQDGSADKFGVGSLIREKLKSFGLQIIEAPPLGEDKSLIAICSINHSNNFYQPVPDRIEIKFINTYAETIYLLEGSSDESMRNYTPEKGLKQATERAFNKIIGYRYTFDSSKTVAKLLEKKLPTLELTGWTEESIKSYLTSNKLDPVEGIYKSYQSEGMPYYKLGIIKSGTIFKAIIIESEVTYWKKGELKATFEQSSMKGFYSIKWYMGDKTPFETFGNMDNEALLSIELKDTKTGEKRQDKFIKLFPTSSSDIAFNKDNSKSSGSGFFITTGGIIATNAHVIEGASNIEVTVSNEIGIFTYKAKVSLADSKNDVALLQIDDEKFKGLTSIPYGITENSDVGSKVFTIGYPLNDVMGSNYKVTDGIISSKSGIADDVRYYQITVPLQPGNSGGPLFDKDGNVIGITSSKLSSQAVGTQIENVNYAIKSSYLLNLYNMLPNSSKLSTNSQVAEKELQDQVKVLKNYVCLIRVY